MKNFWRTYFLHKEIFDNTKYCYTVINTVIKDKKKKA